MMKPRILVIEPDTSLTNRLKTALEKDGFEVTSCRTLKDSESVLKSAVLSNQMIHAMIFEFVSKDPHAHDLLHWAREHKPSLKALVLASEMSQPDMLEMVHWGVHEVLIHPVADQKIVEAIRGLAIRGFEETRGRHAQRCLQARLDRLEGKLEDRFWFVSHSFAMGKVKESLSQLHRLSLNGSAREPHVILEGPVGSGKEGIARMIHAGSRRGKGPWLHFMCPKDMHPTALESELFGHEPGAVPEQISGSHSRRVGLLELASGGTLLIEHIENIPAGLQKKLDQALKTGFAQRMGSAQDYAMDVRCVVTTSSDADDLVERGAISKELLQTLGQMWIQIPQLKERQEDILPLARQMGEKIARELGVTFEGFAPDAEQWLQSHAWPGNVRELWASIERSMLAGLENNSGSVKISGDMDGRSLTMTGQSPEASYTFLKKQWVDHFESEYLKSLVQRHRGNVSASAREAKLDRSNFLRLLRRHGLKAEAFREGGGVANAGSAEEQSEDQVA